MGFVATAPGALGAHLFKPLAAAQGPLLFSPARLYVEAVLERLDRTHANPTLAATAAEQIAERVLNGGTRRTAECRSHAINEKSARRVGGMIIPNWQLVA